MASKRDCLGCGVNLRLKCFFIGYIHLIAIIVDLGLELLILAVSTSGFQCDVDLNKLSAMNWPWLNTLLILLNLGTHGFYPYPIMLGSRRGPMDYVASEPRCYPGMMHIYLIDVLTFLINVIWMKYVIGYVKGLHRRNPVPMKLFFNLYMVKLIIQVMFVAYQPMYQPEETQDLWMLKVTDILISALLLIIVRKYTKQLTEQILLSQVIDHPPSYIECVVNGAPEITVEKKEIPVEENKAVTEKSS